MDALSVGTLEAVVRYAAAIGGLCNQEDAVLRDNALAGQIPALMGWIIVRSCHLHGHTLAVPDYRDRSQRRLIHRNPEVFFQLYIFVTVQVGIQAGIIHTLDVKGEGIVIVIIRQAYSFRSLLSDRRAGGHVPCGQQQ